MWGRQGMKMRDGGIGSDLTPKLNRPHAIPSVGKTERGEQTALKVFFFINHL